MQPLRYSINTTLDGCVDHQAGMPEPVMHRHAEQGIAQADAVIFGRITYQLMEDGWREVAETGNMPDWMEPWMESFAHTIHAAKKYVVSSTLPQPDWHNAELVQGDLKTFITQLKQQPGNGLLVGGVTLPLALAQWDLIDEYEFIVHPRLAGHGPTLMAGLGQYIDLQLIDREEFPSGAMVLRYVPKR